MVTSGVSSTWKRGEEQKRNFNQINPEKSDFKVKKGELHLNERERKKESRDVGHFFG